MKKEKIINIIGIILMSLLMIIVFGGCMSFIIKATRRPPQKINVEKVTKEAGKRFAVLKQAWDEGKKEATNNTGNALSQ